MRATGVFACFVLVSAISACATETAPSGVSGDEQDVVGRATLTLGGEGQNVSGSAILGPQAKSVVPAVAFACGDAPSRTEEVPTAWVELKNPAPKAAVVSFWTAELAGGPRMITSLFAYATPNRPASGADLAKCSRYPAPRHGSFGVEAGSFGHAEGSALFVPASGSVWVLVRDDYRKVGATRIEAKTEVMVAPGPPAPLTVGPGLPQKKDAILVLSPWDVGVVPPSAFACGDVPSSTRKAPRAWVEVQNPSTSTAVVSLWTETVAGGRMTTTLVAYDAATAPITPAQLAACTSIAKPRQGSFGVESGSFHHGSGNALIVDAGQSVRVLVSDAYGMTGALKLVVETEHTDP